MTVPKVTSSAVKVERSCHLRWLPIDEMRVSPVAQRELNRNRVAILAAHFDPEQLGTPTVNLRDGRWYLIDGQHRIEAMRDVGWGDQQIQCWAYEGLTEDEEAERFLVLNDVLSVKAFDKFRVAVAAGREIETDIDRIVRLQGLTISASPDGISAVGTLRRIYGRGPGVLVRTLKITRDAYGDTGLVAPVLDGIGMLCQRYNGDLDDDKAVQQLGSAHGGVGGLLGRAATMRKQMNQQRAHCVAAAAVEIINRGKGGKKLPDWWKTS